MAKHCVNIGSDQFKILADQSDLNILDLSATISLWQDENNTYEFPSIQEVNNFNYSKYGAKAISKKLDNNVYYQNNTNKSNDEFRATEKTIRDLSARMADRIGLKVRYESDRTKDYRGKLEGDTAVINLAHANLDTPIHEILGHPIIRALRSKPVSFDITMFKEGDLISHPITGEIVTVTKPFSTKLREFKVLDSGGITETLSQEDFTDYDYSAHEYGKNIITEDSQLYQNLLKELETGKGKEVLDRVKRDYTVKKTDVGFEDLFSEENDGTLVRETPYTLEEQQEEAIVELLGLMTAGKLNNSKDGKIISLLKRLLKEMKSFMRSLLNQKEVEIDKLPDNMKLGDIADLLAYSNNKLILPGNEVKYTTPDNETFKTYQEASNHISDLTKLGEVDLEKINVKVGKSEEIINKERLLNEELTSFEEKFKNFKFDILPFNEFIDLNTSKGRLRNNYWAKKEDGTEGYLGGSKPYLTDPEYTGMVLSKGYGKDKTTIKITIEEAKQLYDDTKISRKATHDSHQEYLALESKIHQLKQEIKNVDNSEMGGFISKNKPYEQSKEIIEEWKKVNNIKYDPEEVYSRGQGFYSVVGAYSEFDVELMFQNLLTHIEDNQKAGGEFSISAFTKPVDKNIGHLEGGGGKIKFKIHPKSEDIKWASNTDVYSGSVWDASEKVNKDKASEIIGVSYTKTPALQSINTIQPNLADIIDKLNHHHNELGIELKDGNFRLEYDKDIPYSTKKILDNINKILDSKYGKIVEPKISKKQDVSKEITKEFELLHKKVSGTNWKNVTQEEMERHEYLANLINRIGKQPTQTNENLKESIESIKRKNTSLKENEWSVEPFAEGEYAVYTFRGEFVEGQPNFTSLEEATEWLNKNKPSDKEYTSQAEINTKVAALKYGQRKFPRSLIRSEVVKSNITDNYVDEVEDYEIPFQKVPDFNKDKVKPDDTQAKNNAYREKIFNKYDLGSKPKVEEKDLDKLEREVDGKMKNFLSKVFMDVKSVDNIYHNGVKINAIAKADIYKQSIEVVEGLKDITTLPEEAAHVFVALSRGTQGYEAMMNKITEFPEYDEVVNEYGKTYNNDETKLKEEAIGKVIAKEILREGAESTLRPGLVNMVKRAWNNMWKYIAGKLGLLKSKDIALFSNSAKAILNPTKDVINSFDRAMLTQEDYFFEMSKKDTDRVKSILETINPKNAKLKALEIGYSVLATGKKIKHRVSDFVKAYYEQRNNRTDREFSELDKMKAISGTYLHGLREKIMLDLIDGTTHGDMITELPGGIHPYKQSLEKYVKSKISSELPEFKTLLDSQNAKNQGLFEITNTQYYDMVADTKRLHKKIMETNAKINKANKIEGNPPPTIIPEAMIYLEAEDLAGTLDLLVVYNNGAASIYDYKSTDFGYAPKEIGSYKKGGWDVQISQYKRILKLQYGIDQFVETRVIPINAQFTMDPITKQPSVSGYYTLESGAQSYRAEGMDTRRDYLDQVPVADELTDDVALNVSLKKLFIERNKLSNLVSRNPGNADMAVKLEKIDYAIKQIQLKKDVNYVVDEIQELINSYNGRRHYTDKTKPGYLTLSDLLNTSEYAKIFEDFGDNVKSGITEEMIPDADERNQKIKMLEKMESDLSIMVNDINQDINTRLHQDIDFDINDPHLEPDMFGRLFTSLGEWESPAFQSLYKLVLESSDLTRRKTNDVIEDITAKKDELDKWASANGMSLIEAYKKIINPNTKRLIPQLKKEFYDVRTEALRTKDDKWIKSNLEFDKEGFEKSRKNKHASLETRFAGEHNHDELIKRKNDWEARFNEEAIHAGNYFYKPRKDNPKWYSEEWKYMLNNKPLKDYYETLMDYNEMFAEMTGSDIAKNFIPNYRQDTIDRIGQVGLAGIGHMKKNFLHSIEVRDNEMSALDIDEYSGEMRTSIPLFGIQSIRERLSSKEEKEVEQSVIDSGKKRDTLDYEFALEKAIKAAEYKKGNEYKSIDLTRNLILFAKSAFSNKHLQDTEDTARGLKKMLESGMINATIVSEEGSVLMNKLKGVTAKRIGVNPDDIKDFDKFVNMYWYGLHLQNKDSKIGTIPDGLSKMNITDDSDSKRFSTKTYYSRDKIIKKLMQYTSLNNLALDPVLGAVNAVGAWSNAIILGSGGRYFNTKQLKDARNLVFARNPKFKALSGFFEVSARDMTKEKADKASATALTKHVTMDNMFWQYKVGDDAIDHIVLVAMTKDYGIDSDGVIKKMSKITDKSIKSMWEDSSIKNGKISIDRLTDLNDSERLKFKTLVQKANAKIKGTQPEESKRLIGTSIVGSVVMQHRGWIPDLTIARLGKLKYDKYHDEFDVGRFKVIAGELGRSGHLGNMFKSFGTLLTEVALCMPGVSWMHNKSVYDNNTSLRATEFFYNKFISQNPSMKDKLSIPEFLELRQSKLKEFAKEVSIMASFVLMLALMTATLPDDDEEYLTKFLADNSYKIMNRGLLELTFFFSPSSATDILSNPAASISSITKLGRWFKSAAKLAIPTNEFTKDHLGTSDKDLKKFGKNTSQIIPALGSWSDYFGVFTYMFKDK